MPGRAVNTCAKTTRSCAGYGAGPDDGLEAPWEWRKKKLEWVTDFSNESAADCVATIGK